MSSCLGVLCSEGGSEGIDVGQGAGEVLNCELAAYSKESRSAEEIFTVFDVARLLRYIRHLIFHYRSHLEHLTSPFTITSGNNGSMYIEETSFVKVSVCGKGK